MKAVQDAADELPDADDAPPQDSRPLSIGYMDLRGEDEEQLLMMSHRVKETDARAGDKQSGSDSLLASQRVAVTFGSWRNKLGGMRK